MIGQTIKQYRIDEHIGDGGMGSVYKGHDRNLERPVAVKTLHPQLMRDPALRERFQNEARIQAKLSHPNIVSVYDFDTESGTIIMEYLPGKPLDEVIETQTGPMNQDLCVEIFRQVLSAISYAHSYRSPEATSGIVHRDIKPSNIQIVKQGSQTIAKVMDFGIAKIVGDAKRRTATGTAMGTLWYMPPEQIKSAKDVGPQSDIYSLGVTLYEMATGAVPFEGDTEFQIMEQIIKEPPKPPRSVYPGISEAFESVILRAMAKEPAQRFQSCEEFLAALDAAAKGQVQRMPVQGGPHAGSAPPPQYQGAPPAGGAMPPAGQQATPPPGGYQATPPPPGGYTPPPAGGYTPPPGGGMPQESYPPQGGYPAQGGYPPAQKTGGGLGTGAIVGIGLGAGLIALVLLAVGGYFLLSGNSNASNGNGGNLAGVTEPGGNPAGNGGNPGNAGTANPDGGNVAPPPMEDPVSGGGDGGYISPEPISEPIGRGNTKAQDRAAIEGLIYDWASAWSDNVRSISRYQGFYDYDFYSNYKSRSGMNYDEWMSDKRRKGRKASCIRVYVSDLSIDLDGDFATARFMQRYVSNSYCDYGYKNLYLIKRGGRWKIIGEEQPRYKKCGDRC